MFSVDLRADLEFVLNMIRRDSSSIYIRFESDSPYTSIKCENTFLYILDMGDYFRITESIQNTGKIDKSLLVIEMCLDEPGVVLDLSQRRNVGNQTWEPNE